MMQSSSVVTATAVAVLANGLRRGDAALLQRLVLDSAGSPIGALRAVAVAFAIRGYEKAVAAVLRKTGLQRMPSTLAAMLSLFGALRAIRVVSGKEAADRAARLFAPGVQLLGRWMGLFLAPPLAALDGSLSALPSYSSGVWMRTAGLMLSGWAATCTFAGTVAKRTKVAGTSGAPKSVQAVVASPIRLGAGSGEVDQTEATLRSWMLITAAGFLGHAIVPLAYQGWTGRLCQLGTAVTSFQLADKRLPPAVKSSLHPLVVCAVMTNLSSRGLGSVVPPWLGTGRGVGDVLFQWLPAAVSGLGVRMYETTDKWYDDAGNLRCVAITSCTTAAFSVICTTIAASHPSSPLKIPAPLGLPLTNRSVMSALGIEGSLAIGPECDPKLAVASILITGCIGASFGNSLLQAVVADTSPLVRGLAMGCSAHSIGTAALIADNDPESAAISSATMCIMGTAHTLLLNLPGVVPMIRAMAFST